MRYFIGFLVTIGLIVLILFLLLTGGGKKDQKAPHIFRVDDYAYSDTAVAEMIVDGALNADPDHNEIKIDVSKTTISVTVYQGYNQTVLNTQSFENNDRAFAVFMHALQHANFDKGNNSKALQDERGYCPAGTRTIYSLSTGEGQLMRYWQSSCGQGTFKGNSSTVSYLFKQQVPSADFSNLTKNLKLAF